MRIPAFAPGRAVSWKGPPPRLDPAPRVRPARAGSNETVVPMDDSPAPPGEVAPYFRACTAGDTETLSALLTASPSLVQARTPDGATGLHLAVRHPDVLRLLLARGADPNVRESGDHALALHAAAGGGLIESARVLLEGGSDPQGSGDAHRLDTVGWATCFGDAHREVADLLVAHGARHHVFSAIALGDLSLVRRVVEDDPAALARRLAPTEQEQTALHYVVAPPDGLVGGRFRTGAHYRTLQLLIDLGADLDVRDARGRTAVEVALLRGDREATRILHAAGAALPELPEGPSGPRPVDLATSIRRVSPMLAVPDLTATLHWYRTVGFDLATSHGEEGNLDWVSLAWGETEIMLVPAGDRPPSYAGLSLWIKTDRLDDVYARLRRHQLARGRALLAEGMTAEPEIRFTLDLYTAFYGQREFTVVDPNGVELSFYQPVD